MWQASRGCKSVGVRTTEKGDQPSRTGWAINPRKLAGRLGERLRSVAEHILAQCGVEALCKGFPQRVAQLVEAKGDRLKF